MNFDKGWSRIERLLLILAVITSAIGGALFAELCYDYYQTGSGQGFQDSPPFLQYVLQIWGVYLAARIFGWIVKGFIDKGTAQSNEKD